MKKQIKFILLLLVFIYAHESSAHAVITNYSLKITPIHVNTAAKVELSFNSQIELGLSQIFLVSKGDTHKKLEAVNGAKQGQVVVSIPALDAGDYALRFKVFAADGHLTEDVIHFSVSK